MKPSGLNAAARFLRTLSSQVLLRSHLGMRGTYDSKRLDLFITRRQQLHRAPPATRTKLLLEGPILPTLLRLAAPNILNLLAFVGVIVFDGFFLGRIGTDALAGASLAFPFVMLVLQTTNSGMGAGVSSAVARALGASKRERADEIVFHAFLLALALGAIFSIVMLLAAPFIFQWMGGRDKMLADALSYANVALGGAVCITVLNLLGNAVRGTGNMSLHAGVLVGCVVAHIAMSPVLIFGWGPIPALGSCRRGLGSRDPVRRRQPHHDRLPALLTFDRAVQFPRYGAALGDICRHSQGRRSRLGEHGNHQSVSRGADGHRRTVRSASCHRLRHGRAPRIHHATQ